MGFKDAVTTANSMCVYYPPFLQHGEEQEEVVLFGACGAVQPLMHVCVYSPCFSPSQGIHFCSTTYILPPRADKKYDLTLRTN